MAESGKKWGQTVYVCKYSSNSTSVKCPSYLYVCICVCRLMPHNTQAHSHNHTQTFAVKLCLKLLFKNLNPMAFKIDTFIQLNINYFNCEKT